MRVEWVHPSWRDLVIDHLAADPAARERFLSRCGVHGLLLSLSVAGGRDGQRRLPLLIRDADWDTLTDRVYSVAPQLDVPDVAALLSGIDEAVHGAGRDQASEAVALARAVLGRLAQSWDDARDPIPFPALSAWVALAGRRVLSATPPPWPDLDRTWAELFPAASPHLADREGIERFGDWLALAELVRLHRPGALARLRFGDAVDVTDEFLIAVERSPDTIHPAARDNVLAALRCIEALMPPFESRAGYLATWLGATDREHAAVSGYRDPPPTRERIGWTRFDVGRVLQDL